MTESKMQEILNQYLYKLKHKYITENVYVWSWESDMISVTEAGYIKEYEIKLSKSDFKQDFKKKVKHNLLEMPKAIYKPSQFYYVIHGFKLNIDEVPEYAGLLKVFGDDNCYINIIKPAPKISDQKVTEYIKRTLFEVTYSRYWNLRLRNRKQAELF